MSVFTISVKLDHNDSVVDADLKIIASDETQALFLGGFMMAFNKGIPDDFTSQRELMEMLQNLSVTGVVKEEE